MLLPALRERRGERGQVARPRQARALELGAHLRALGRVRRFGGGARDGRASRRARRTDARRDGRRDALSVRRSARERTRAGSRARRRRGGRSRARSEEPRAEHLFGGRAPGARGDLSREPRRGGGLSGRGSREHPASRARTRRVRAVRDERGATRCGRPRAKTRTRSANGAPLHAFVKPEKKADILQKALVGNTGKLGSY